MTQPDILTIGNIAALVTIAGIGVKLTRTLARMEIKVDLMWADFRARMPYARESDREQ